MNFERLLLKAKEGNADAVLKILEIYKPLLIKNAKEEPIDCANAVMCCISQLRKKLKVDSRNWNYIRTVRGVGYKFQPLSGE